VLYCTGEAYISVLGRTCGWIDRTMSQCAFCVGSASLAVNLVCEQVFYLFKSFSPLLGGATH